MDTAWTDEQPRLHDYLIEEASNTSLNETTVEINQQYYEQPHPDPQHYQQQQFNQQYHQPHPNQQYYEQPQTNQSNNHSHHEQFSTLYNRRLARRLRAQNSLLVEENEALHESLKNRELLLQQNRSLQEQNNILRETIRQQQAALEAIKKVVNSNNGFVGSADLGPYYENP